jgi:NADPH-dependent glutamate synthase beta subunit-like oxidoreductase
LKRSIDARQKTIKVNLKYLFTEKEVWGNKINLPDYPNVASKQVIVVGAGPAGLFAACNWLSWGWSQ